MVVGPVLGVPLLQPAENFCRLVQSLQLQQQLSWNQKPSHHIKSKRERVRGEVRRRRLAFLLPYLASPPPPACRRSASRSWTGAPGPPCTDLPPSAPGSGRAAARCTRNPPCQETSEWTEVEREWWVGGWGHGIVERVFSERVPARYGWLCCFKCTKTGSSLLLSEGSDRTGASGHFESTVVSRLAVN